MNVHKTKITDSVLGISLNDTTLDLFESQYPVPEGVSYNTYLIRDEKTAVLDTVDARATDLWLETLEAELAGTAPDYLVVSHVEPDHSANVARLAAKYPEMKVVGNAKTFAFLANFFPGSISADRQVMVKEGDELSLGSHTLHFVMAPMVHWPEVMFSYESSEKLLFSADAFGRFGVVADGDSIDNWVEESRRYYLNIVGKYGAQVQAVLKKAATLEIAQICPLHGPVLKGDLAPYLSLYETWSKYLPEAPQEVLVASASIHGHTREAAHTMAEKLRAAGAQVTEIDLTRTDVSYAVAQAFRCGKMVLAAATYDASLFPAMESFLIHLKSKNFQGRTIGLMENGMWAPMAAKLMTAALTTVKGVTLCEQVVTIRGAAHAAEEAQMDTLVGQLMAQ